MSVRVLSGREVEELLDEASLIDAVASALADLSAGRACVPPRIAALTPGGLLGAMVAHVPALDCLAAKLVSVYPQNRELPTHQAAILAFDPQSGAPVALMDGTAITAQRTAAASALSTRLLAREDARILTIIGTGVQARSHARFVSRVRDFRELRIGGRDPLRTRRFVESLDIAARAMSIPDALRGADVICATTHAEEPVVPAQSIAHGAHVTSVGFHPQGGELDPALVRGALLAVESRGSSFAPPPAGANELRGIDPQSAVELGELVLGTRPGRSSSAQITVYKSVGVAAEDAAAAALVLRRARERGAGRSIDL